MLVRDHDHALLEPHRLRPGPRSTIRIRRMKRMIVSANRELLLSRRAHHFPDRFDIAPHRRFPELGLQRQMGLLPVWRNRAHPADCAHSRADREIIGLRQPPRNRAIGAATALAVGTAGCLPRLLRRRSGVVTITAYRVLVSDRFKAAEDSDVLRFLAEKLRFVSK
jgi:hypothetical protein